MKALRLVGGELRVTWWNDAVFAAQGMQGDGLIVFVTREIPADRWLRFMFRVKCSPDQRGLMKMWIDGQEQTAYAGAIG